MQRCVLNVASRLGPSHALTRCQGSSRLSIRAPQPASVLHLQTHRRHERAYVIMSTSPLSQPVAPAEEHQPEGGPWEDEDEIPYPETTSEHTLLPPSNFRPFFTVVDDTSTGEHYHPFVHYVFSDDDPVIVTAAAMRSLGLDDTRYLPQPEQDRAEQDEEGQELPVQSPLPPPLPAMKERFIIIDVAADGQTIVNAQSMSPDWQVTNASTRIAPSFDESSPDSGYMLQIEGIEVPRKGKGKNQPGESKLKDARERSQDDLFGALDGLIASVESNLEVATGLHQPAFQKQPDQTEPHE